ncbi:uncharacterized protein LOC116105346 [Pistacia vera]|uniref:uncharacterized protein LOC116105346 n=1 Tax=Pistacia vera TaxID=55513 RepID=UPI00126323D7|nr:uncharacterized protein LOC116105346 [Pistacia vera]
MAKGNTNALALAIPIFTGENYDVWSIKMKTYFLSQDLWDIVNYENYLEITGSTLFEEYQKQLKESKKNDAAALFILQQAVDDNIFRKISRAQKAKEAWDALKEEFTVQGKSYCGVSTGSDVSASMFLKNKEGNTVLSIAAIVGNVQAACMIMKKDENQTLIQDSNKSKRIPLIEATRHGQKKMINYLLQFSSNYLDYDSATRFTSGVLLVKLLITAEFYGGRAFVNKSANWSEEEHGMRWIKPA